MTRRLAHFYVATFSQLSLTLVTIACMLGLAYLMNYVVINRHWAWPWRQPAGIPHAVLGWLGVFLTGSDTSSNALFGNLQVIAADALSILCLPRQRNSGPE